MNDTSHNGFTPIQNPYIVGNPIKDQNMFFGREDDFAYTKSKIIGGKRGGLLVLCGARRSGKTSILFQIKGGRLGEDFVPVLIDMQSMTVKSDRDFLSKMAREIVQTLATSDIDFERDFLEPAEADPFSAFEELIKKINRHLQGRKLVLMFDEYEIIENLIEKNDITSNILLILSNWMEHKEGVFVIFTGSDRLQARDPKCWERFLGRALHRRISFLSKNDTLRLVKEPVAGMVDYGNAVPDLIYDLTAGQPFYTQVLCQSIVDHLNEDRKREVETGDVQQVVQEIIENPLPQMIFAWSSLNNLEKLSLSIIAELTKDGVREKPVADIISFPERERIDYRIDSNKVNESLERLFHYDLLDKDEDGGTYIFKMDLWRQWITRMHSIWQVIDEIQGAGEGMGEGIERVQRSGARRYMTGLAAVALFAVAFALVYLFALKPGRNDAGSGGFSPAVIDSTVLSVTTIPPGATVYLDERRMGQTPLASRQVPAGNLIMRIEKDGYRTIEDTLLLEKDVAAERSLTLVELTGAVAVNTSPAGADITLDGERTGFKSPHTFGGLSVNGQHTVTVSLQGFNAKTDASISVYPDSTITWLHTFSARTHPLTVRSNPGGAQVFIDGREYGTTPNLVSRLSEDSHTLLLKKTGFLDYREEIRIPQPGNQVTVTLTPAPPGTAVLIIVPFADIYVNDELVKRNTPNERITRQPGTYRIRLVHPNWGTIEDVIEIESGKEITKEYNMQSGAKK